MLSSSYLKNWNVMLFLSMQQVRKLHLPNEIQSISKVLVILEHLFMENNARRPRWWVAFWWQETCFFHSTPMINYSWFQSMDTTTIDSTQQFYEKHRVWSYDFHQKKQQYIKKSLKKSRLFLSAFIVLQQNAKL